MSKEFTNEDAKELKEFLIGANYEHNDAEIIAGVVLYGGWRRTEKPNHEIPRTFTTESCKRCGSDRHSTEERSCCSCTFFVCDGQKCAKGIITTRNARCSLWGQKA